MGEIFAVQPAKVYLFCILLWCIVSALVKAAWQGEEFPRCEGEDVFWRRLMMLLEVLMQQTGCEYLSDLRRIPQPNARLRSAVAQLSLDAFAAHEWIDAANYLCGICCESAEEARNAILEHA